MVASSARTSLRGFGGVDFFGDAGELGLIFVEVGVGDLEEAVEGDVDHLVVEEFFAEGVGAESVVAVGAGEEIGLHPCAVGFEGVDDGGVGFGEGGFGCRRRWRLGAEKKAEGTSFWKKLMRPSICSRAISV